MIGAIGPRPGEIDHPLPAVVSVKLRVPTKGIEIGVPVVGIAFDDRVNASPRPFGQEAIGGVRPNQIVARPLDAALVHMVLEV